MARARVKMNRAGCISIRNSSEVMGDLLERAQRIKAKSDGVGSGVYEADVRPGKTRAHAMVKTTDPRSMASNAKHNTLLKSLYAGRG